RQDLVMMLLVSTRLSLEQIADRTGFSEASALVRAFKGWTGMPPNQYRQRLTAYKQPSKHC
ncbi:MAG: AraC family transcriptional regulator, partial [Gammaproteobacteria bacterium]|nr:AraC family transcriptional regulator [Gammaproteobacteria bacterium]